MPPVYTLIHSLPSLLHLHSFRCVHLWQPSTARKACQSIKGSTAEMLSAVQAISDRLGVKMYIITSYEQSGVIEIKPNGPTKSERILYLSFWAEVPFPPPPICSHFCFLTATCS